MKSVIIVGPAWPLRGGLASFDERLARAFKEAGYDVSIDTFSLQYPSFLFPGKTQYSSEPAPTDLLIRVGINSINPFNWIWIGWQLRKSKADFIVVRYWLPFMGPCLGTILRMARGNKKSRIVCIADNVIPHEKRIGDRWFTKYFVKPIHRFITMSEKVQMDLQQFTSKPSTLVRHPLYDHFGERVSSIEARERLNLNSSPLIFLFFGFIRGYKGLDILFDAIHLLKEKTGKTPQEVMFVIAGEFYEDQEPYRRQIEKLGIQPYLSLHTEFIPDSMVKYYFSAADCVVQPYKQATQSGVTPLAIHYEVPTLVTNVGGLANYVPNGVGFVTEPMAEAVADTLQRFMEEPLKNYKEAIQLEKKKYSWQALVDAIVS